MLNVQQPAIAESAYNLALMKRIDELFLVVLFSGSRQMRNIQRDEGHPIGRNRVRRLIRKMGLMAVYQKPKTRQPHPQHRRIHTCCGARRLREQTRCGTLDITCIPMRRGFLHLVTIMDWLSRAVLSWCVSDTMMLISVQSLGGDNEPLRRPGIFSTDQGSQFTIYRIHVNAQRGRSAHLNGWVRPQNG